MTTALNRIATAVTDLHLVDKQRNTQINYNAKTLIFKRKNTLTEFRYTMNTRPE